ncbi:MAG: hypothetical protein KDC74_04175 [Flavobacteriaceae bacterium]|jgi:hypothetical protein|nr:hypothetical protein [Flavobacteriaceae bacterium]
MCKDNIKLILQKFAPNLFSIVDSLIDYNELCERIKGFLKKNDGKIRPKNFISIIINIMLETSGKTNNDRLYINELVFIDKKIEKALEIIPKEKYKKLGELFKSMIFDFSQLSILNPIGEVLSLLKLNERPNYSFVDYEVNFPNGKSKDFKFRNNLNGKYEIVEVVNISFDSTKYQNQDGLKKYICDKLDYKIKEETRNLDPNFDKSSLKFLIIIHGLDIEIAKESEAIFREFKKRKGKICVNRDYDIFPIFSIYNDTKLGFTTYDFDEITNILKPH